MYDGTIIRLDENYKESDKKQIIDWLLSTDTLGMFSLLKYMEDNKFYDAPCSAGHHLSCDGGLAKHSLSVLNYALHLKLRYSIPIPINSIIKCALLHDVHKMFLYEKRGNKWEYRKVYNKHLHGDWAMQIITTFIRLTKQEKEMILWHMGPYTEYYDCHKPGDFLNWSNDKGNKNVRAALFLYFCDHFSSMFLED